MKISITKKFTFEAAHHLPSHDGKCRNMHGHSYILEVTVIGPIETTGPKEGMVMDFSDLKKIVKEKIINDWDHSLLNEKVSFIPTAENLAQECFTRLKNSGILVTKIRLSETETSFVEVVE